MNAVTKTYFIVNLHKMVTLWERGPNHITTINGEVFTKDVMKMFHIIRARYLIMYKLLYK